MTASEEMKDDWAWLAKIRRPQGRKGEVFADILTDYPEKFAERKRLWLLGGTSGAGGRADGAGGNPAASKSSREVELSAHWLHKGGVVLHFAGVDSISAAETLTGMTVAVPRSERTTLSDDEVYIGDLIGCEVVDVSGASEIVVGRIEDVDRTAGPVPLLMIEKAGGEVLVPFAKNYLRKIDLQARRVEMALPEGLIELNS